MVRGPGAWLLALLVLSPAASLVAPLGEAQGNNTTAPAPPPPPPGGAPPPTAFDPLPQEVMNEAFRWLDEANASIAAFKALHPEQNTTIAVIFRDGAWDFLNESRLSLGMSQLLQVHIQLTLQGFFPGLAEEERRNASLQRAEQERAKSQAQVDAFAARLRALDAQLKTTHAIEYAVQAALAWTVADDLVREAPNTTAQLQQAPAAEERIVRLTLIGTAGPQAYAGFATDLLALAERANADASRPQLPANATALLAAKIQQRLELDPDSQSTTGPQSSKGLSVLNEAQASGVASLQLARFVTFEMARTVDSLDFLRTRGGLSDQVLVANLRTVTENASWVPRYDGRLERLEGLPLLEQVRAAGYQGVLQADARNQALYRLQWDPSFSGATAAWAQAVGARYDAETLREVPAPHVQGGGGSDLLLYGGIAVVAAVAVVAFALLRKP